MKHEILPNGDLKITVTDEERHQLQLMKVADPFFDSDSNLHDILEPLIANSELEWAAPCEIGALTDAPTLSTWMPERPLRRDEEIGRGNRYSGRDGEYTLVQDFAAAWGFMDYQVRSVQQDLLERGEAIFQNAFSK